MQSKSVATQAASLPSERQFVKLRQTIRENNNIAVTNIFLEVHNQAIIARKAHATVGKPHKANFQVSFQRFVLNK